MNRKTAISALIALTMAAGQLAFAQGNSDREWVQLGGDYVLIAIATGIIAQLLLSH